MIIARIEYAAEFEREYTNSREPICFVAEEIETLTAPDPFGIDDPCPENPEGHFPIWEGRRTLVCAHCPRILWCS